MDTFFRDGFRKFGDKPLGVVRKEAFYKVSRAQVSRPPNLTAQYWSQKILFDAREA